MDELVNATLVGSRESRPSIKLKFRDGNKVKYSTLRGIYPYFYVNPTEKLHFPFHEKESGHISYMGKPLDKLSFTSIDQLETGRRNVDFSMESDIFYLTRFLIDSNLVFGLNRRILYFDIEVKMEKGSLDTENAPQPVIVIVAFDNFTNRYYSFTMREYAEDDVNAFVFDDEVILLNNFFAFCNRMNPDIMIGWNSNNYDFPYLLNRSKRTDLFGTYHHQLYYNNTQPLDLMKTYMEFGERGGRYFLDHVASLVLNKRKTKGLGVLSHCIEDVMLTKEIDEKLKLSQLVFAFQHIVPLNTIDIMSRSAIIEAFMLKKYHNKYVIPNRGHVKHIKYKGAIVRDPVKGLHENVLVLDLVSLYPSIVMHNNISPDRDIRDPGILSEAIEEIFNKRMVHKKAYKEKGDTQSDIWNTSYKFLLNAFIGILGFSNSRFYNRELAAEVTGWERKLLTRIWNFAEDKGIQLLAGDTDSFFCEYNKPLELVDEVNEMLHVEWGEEFNIDLDKQFKILFLYDKKKNYFGLTKEGNLKITGTVVNRTSCPLYIRTKLMEAFKLILEKKSTKSIKEEVSKKIREQNIMDIAEWMRLSSIDPKVSTAHLKAAKNRLRIYRIPFYQGEKLPLIPTKDPHIGYLAIHEGIIDNLPEIDYDTILEKWFNRPLKEIENILTQTHLFI